MADVDKAIATQISNIEKKTGRTLAELRAAIAGCGKATHVALASDGASAAKATGASTDDVLREIYSGKKEHLRPIHDKLMEAIAGFGEFEIAPKKGYVSLRRKKQFAMLGPKTNDRFELGLNIKGEVKDPRVKALPPGGMCPYVVPLTSADQVDAKLVAIVRKAFDGAA
jgi:hypothetical protein